MNQPSVSVVIATRERPELLRRAIASVWAQRYDGDIECVIVFDQTEPADLGDVEPTEAHRRISVIRNRRTPGLAGARNAGIEASFGSMVAFCDDDDEWLPEKLALQVEALQRSGSSVCVTGIQIDYRDETTVRIPPDPVTRDHLLHARATAVHPSSVVVTRDALEGVIGLVDEEIPGSYGEDYEWLLRASAAGPIAAVPRPLVRVHWGGSLFADRWQTIVAAIEYLMRKHPDVVRDRHNAARLFGRLAFAHAAQGNRRESLRWAWRSIARRPAERRPYLALAVASGAVKAATIQDRANRAGRGV